MKEKTNNVCLIDKTLVGTEESARAVTWSCSVNNVFWKIWEIKDTNMRDVSTVKLMLFQSFIFLIFSYVAIKNFDWCFSSNLMNQKTSYFLKI